MVALAGEGKRLTRLKLGAEAAVFLGTEGTQQEVPEGLPTGRRPGGHPSTPCASGREGGIHPAVKPPRANGGNAPKDTGSQQDGEEGKNWPHAGHGSAGTGRP